MFKSPHLLRSRLYCRPLSSCGFCGPTSRILLLLFGCLQTLTCACVHLISTPNFPSKILISLVQSLDCLKMQTLQSQINDFPHKTSSFSRLPFANTWKPLCPDVIHKSETEEIRFDPCFPGSASSSSSCYLPPKYVHRLLCNSPHARVPERPPPVAHTAMVISQVLGPQSRQPALICDAHYSQRHLSKHKSDHVTPSA